MASEDIDPRRGKAKNLQATIQYVNFTKAFDSIYSGKMEESFLHTAYLNRPSKQQRFFTETPKYVHRMETQNTSTL